MTKRIFISPNRVTVSKPGFDAENPPAVDYRYLALDSRLASGRPLEIGVVPNVYYGLTVNFTTTYAGVPAVDLVIFSSTSSINAYNYINGIVMRDANSSVAYNRTTYYLGISTSQFAVVDDGTYVRSALLTSGYPGFYIAWQNW
jgi:hypothetical protein